MPAQSKAQQKFMGLVHALQKGDIDPSSVSQDVRDAAASMSRKAAKDFAATKQSGLPKKVKSEAILDEMLQLPLHAVAPDLLPGYIFNTIKDSNRERLHRILLDLKQTLNTFYKRNGIDRKIK